MKCPGCGSDRFEPYDIDPGLMGCRDCHDTYSISWCIGYWTGYIDGERDGKKQAQQEFRVWARQRFEEEVADQPKENICKETLRKTWQQVIDKLVEKNE